MVARGDSGFQAQPPDDWTLSVCEFAGRPAPHDIRCGRFVNFNFIDLEVDDAGRVHIVKNDSEWEIDKQLQRLGVACDDICIARHELGTS